MSNIRDYAIGSVLTAPSPTTSGTTIVLQSGEGSIMPTDVPFKVTAVPQGVIPTLSNCEKLLVTGLSGDTLTVTRAQGATTAKSIATGWLIVNSVFTEDQFNASMVMNETLAGTVNGTNKVFTTSTAFTLIAVYKNGVRMAPTNDYTITGNNQITFVTAPASLSVLKADYMVGALININGSNSLIQKEAAVGTINGSNTAFTTQRPYVGGSLQVYVNGLAHGTTAITETTPSTGAFTLDVAPLTGDDVQVAYQFATGTFGNADTVDGYHANATVTAGTIPVLDSGAKLATSINGVGMGFIVGSTLGTTGNKSVTGLGFKPQIVKFTVLQSTSAPTLSSGSALLNMGAMTATAQYTVSLSTGASAELRRTSEQTSCIRYVSGSGADALRATRTSLDSDGFTINVVTANSSFDVAWEAWA